MSFKTSIYGLLTYWANWTLNNPVLVLLFVSVITFFAGQYTVNHLSIDTDTTDMVAPNAPFQKNLRNYEKSFSQDLHAILLLIESDTP